MIPFIIRQSVLLVDFLSFFYVIIIIIIYLFFFFWLILLWKARVGNVAFSLRLSATALDEEYVSTLFSHKKRVFFLDGFSYLTWHNKFSSSNV